MRAAIAGGARPSRSTACSATAPARPDRRAIPTSTMTTGCGAATCKAIEYTLTHGIRHPGDRRDPHQPDAGLRRRDPEPAQISACHRHVLSLRARGQCRGRRRGSSSPPTARPAMARRQGMPRSSARPTSPMRSGSMAGTAEEVTRQQIPSPAHGVMPAWQPARSGDDQDAGRLCPLAGRREEAAPAAPHHPTAPASKPRSQQGRPMVIPPRTIRREPSRSPATGRRRSTKSASRSSQARSTGRSAASSGW
jgi:hypothetical protein